MSTLSRTAKPRFFFNPGDWLRTLRPASLTRATSFGMITIGALIAFEIFNYSTTEFALTDLLGDLSFAGLRWSTILALAFCSMDFAGIARLFSPQQKPKQSLEIWYLLGAWILAAAMNALLSWWAVSLALLGHEGLGNEIIGREALLSSVPVFVAMLVLLIRVLLIGSFTLTGARLFKAPASSAGPSPARSSVSATPRRTPSASRAIRQPSAPISSRANGREPLAARGSRRAR